MTFPYKRKNTYWRGRNVRAKKRSNAIHGSKSAAERQKMSLNPPAPKPRIRPSRPIKGKTPMQTLPYETLAQIFSYLRHDPTPAIEILSRVCHRFRTIIKTAPSLRSDIPGKTLGKQLHCAELLHPYLFPKHHLACYACNRVFDSGRDELKFASFEKRNGKGFGGIRAKSRRCTECHYNKRSRHRRASSSGSGHEGRLGATGNFLTRAGRAEWRVQLLLRAPFLAQAHPYHAICLVAMELTEKRRRKALRDEMSDIERTGPKASLRKQNREKVAADLDGVLAEGFAKVFDHKWLEARDEGWELWDLSSWRSPPVVQDW